MKPLPTTAANLVPVLSDAIEYQFFEGAVVVFQVEPESVDVQMPPPKTTAAKLCPSLDDAI